jgi:hypothetical protein
MMHSYNIICYGYYTRKFQDNVTLMMFYEFKLPSVAILVLIISICILYITTSFFCEASWWLVYKPETCSCWFQQKIYVLCLRVIFIGFNEVLLHCTNMIYTERLKHFLMLSNICGLTLKKEILTKFHPPIVVGIISHKVTVSTQETFTE